MKKILSLVIVAMCFITEIKAQHIPDAEFARAIHDLYPNSIDGKDDLLPAAGYIKELELIIFHIRNLSGIEGFLSLKILDISNEEFLTELPVLPNTIEKLYCMNTGLTHIDHLPDSLKLLFCGGSQLTSLPILPQNIFQVDCSGNKLNSLPSLPESLLYLGCNNNQLTSLPKLPKNLITLSCANNKIKHIPNIPSSLSKLTCDVAMIDNVPKNSATVAITDASGNIITFVGKEVVKTTPNIVKTEPPAVVTTQPTSLFEQLKTGFRRPFVGHGKIYEYKDQECSLSLDLHMEEEYEQMYYYHVHGTFKFTITINGTEYTAIERVKGVIDVKTKEIQLDFEYWKSKPDEIPNGTVCPLRQNLKMYEDGAHIGYMLLKGQAHRAGDSCPDDFNGGHVEYTSYPQ